MFLHAGNGKTVREKDIIGIFDTDNSTLSSPATRRFLSEAEKNGLVELTGTDIPKSFILYFEPDTGSGARAGGSARGPRRCRVCLSALASGILVQRSGSGTDYNLRKEKYGKK
ncbi:MAG: DUF370 domain-containing protein [Clostridia bacterium]|nr:DUF370 domain-containing protein [Clostridia bacterium]